MDLLSRYVPEMREIPTDELTDAADDAAIAYYRVSGRSQVETDYDPEGNSLPTQREFVEETARRLKKTIIAEYVEPGVSALPIDKRPAFRDMIDRIIEKRDVKYVIVYMLNRFARNRYEDAIVGLTLERLGVTVISAKENIHGNDPAEKMMRGMLAVYNQYQSEASSADIKVKLARKARQGGTIGYAPIGYLNVTEEYEGRKSTPLPWMPNAAPTSPTSPNCMPPDATPSQTSATSSPNKAYAPDPPKNIQQEHPSQSVTSARSSATATTAVTSPTTVLNTKAATHP
jgi:DNA invertase Pin-like site-specific DNA recombinase